MVLLYVETLQNFTASGCGALHDVPGQSFTTNARESYSRCAAHVCLPGLGTVDSDREPVDSADETVGWR